MSLIPRTKQEERDAELAASAQELLGCLRELVDFSETMSSHYRLEERSKAARKAAYDLLRRLGG